MRELAKLGPGLDDEGLVEVDIDETDRARGVEGAGDRDHRRSPGDLDEGLRVADSRGPQEHGVDDAEDGGIDADSDS